jgi:hypothetical protein
MKGPGEHTSAGMALAAASAAKVMVMRLLNCMLAAVVRRE